MKNTIAVLLAVLLLMMVAAPLAVRAQADSPSNPAAIGSPVRSMVELGSVYSTIYDITITVLETVRGKEAMERLRAASADITPPKAGFEYLLAKVKFGMKGRSLRDKLTFDLGSSPLQWVAFSADMSEYDGVSIAVPKPELKGIVRPDQVVEGWVAFAVEQKESKPIMVFDPDSGGASGRGKPLFFKLY